MIALKDNIRTPIDDYLNRQRLDTPVAAFARVHEENRLPSMEPYYRSLIPLSAPESGEQYAFRVDLDKCTGCKACVSACHSLNGLEENESWRDVGMIVGGNNGNAYMQTVTTACHHCADPGCLNGCPVKAYEKDPDTGIVHHLDDQCIGCEYCIMKCPYDVPKYSESKGIVRKCDMCHNRLAEGEAPACVQGCPTHAISITIVDTSGIRQEADAGHTMLPGAHDSSYTVPATRFVSSKEMPEGTVAADDNQLKLEPAHWPLVFMLTLTQASVGVFFMEVIVSGIVGLHTSWHGPALGLFFLMTGLNASIFHLGKPLKAWRFFMGLRTSWLSREIAVFSAFAALAPLCLILSTGLLPIPAAFTLPVYAATTLVGLVGVYCSAKIYEDTHRTFWKARYTFSKFFGSATVIGIAGCGLCLAVNGFSANALWVALIAVSLALLAAEGAFLLRGKTKDPEKLWKSSLIMKRLLPGMTVVRFACGIVGGVLLPVMILGGFVNALDGGALALGFCVTAEIAQRYLFFRAVVPLKMPGGVLTYDAHS